MDHSQGHPALGGAVHLGEDQAGEPHRLVEQAGLAQGILAGGGVQEIGRASCRERVLTDV